MSVSVPPPRVVVPALMLLAVDLWYKSYVETLASSYDSYKSNFEIAHSSNNVRRGFSMDKIVI